MMKQKIICSLIFTILITTTLPVSGNDFYSSEQSSESTNFDVVEKGYNPLLADVLVRINETDGNFVLLEDVEVLGGKPGEWVNVIMPRYRLHELSNIHADYSVLIWDVDSYSQSFAGQYHTLAEMEQMLQEIADSYPNITSLYSLGTTYEGRDIWCLEISDNPGVDEGEPGVFYMGLHHAREWPTLEICLYIAENLTSHYNIDSDITDVINNRRLWLVPCVNPDGYYFCHDHSLPHDWRKNRHFFPEFGTYGVDLNRNYGGSSNGDVWGSWGSLVSSFITHSPNYEVYCGPSPTSEYETQAILDVFLKNDICASISWHTFSELVMWPWGYSSSKVTPDDIYMSHVGEQIASRITKQSGYGTYDPTQSSSLYPTTGDTIDWAYGYGHYVLGRPTFAYTIEACSSFQPDSSHLDQICKENFDGALYFLQEAENISNVVPRVLPPIIDTLYSEPDENFTVSWTEQNLDAELDYYQLDELTNMSLVTDDVGSDSGLWVLDGFSITDTKYHSIGNSFKSRRTNSDVSSMTSVYPIPITRGVALSFWCWFDIETNCDYAFVEISKDGRYYHLLDKFTGSSESWIYKSYDLDEYVGESIFIRFRYSTDADIVRGGFYVDDISPVADFKSVVTLSDDIINEYYDIINRIEGDYYYRVKGHNSKHGWGDFSTLEKMHVGFVDNDAPNIPIINGLSNGKTGEVYDYTFLSYDPNEDDVYFYVEWGDGNFCEWIGPFNSGEEMNVNHTFLEKGTYTIRAKAKDIYGAESGWGTLEVNMPRNKQFIYSFFIRLLDKLVHQFPLLQFILD